MLLGERYGSVLFFYKMFLELFKSNNHEISNIYENFQAVVRGLESG